MRRQPSVRRREGRKRRPSIDRGDPQARAFHGAREWKDAWDKKAEKALVAIIAGAPANGLKPDLFLKGELPKDPAKRRRP